MRKKFILFIFIPFLILAVLTYFFIDRWIESGLESAGEAMVGAKVEIDDLSIGFFPLRLQFFRMQVANPNNAWNNLFETERVTFAIDVNQLLRRKIIIDTVEVRNFILGTKRTTDGSLPKKAEKNNDSPSFSQQLAKHIEQDIKNVPVFDLEKLRKDLKIDSILNKESLSTVRYIDTLRGQIIAVGGQWKAMIADLEATKQRLATMESNLRAIKPNELKTLDAITSAINNVNSSYTTLKEINDSYKTRKNSITTDVNAVTGSIKLIDDVVKEDINRVKGLARLPDLRLGGISDLLFAQQLYGEVQTYLGYIDMVRENVKKYTPKPDFEKPKRFEGQDIHFPIPQEYPRFWIKTVHLSGGTEKRRDMNFFYASGDIFNITNNQRLTGQPITALIKATKGNRTTLDLKATLDRRGETSLDNYKASVKGIPVEDLQVGRLSFLPSRITQSDLAVTAEVMVPGKTFDGKSSITFRNVALVFEKEPRNTVERLTRDVLSRVRNFDMNLRAWNTSGKMQVHFSTDLDVQLYEQTKRVLGEELMHIQNDIHAKVERKIAEKRREVERMFEEKKNEVLAQVQEYENLVNEKISLVEAKKKELEKRIEEEKSKGVDAAKKKLEDALKGIIKKQ